MVAIVTAWFAHPAWAGTVEPTLTLTEVSNTQLDWAWDAAGGGSSGSITAVLADQWLNTSISGPTLSATVEVVASWAEPEDAGFHNLVDVAYNQTTWIIVTVNSDVIGTGGIPNGVTGHFDPFLQIKFVDNAATSEAPDTGTTGSLLGLSLTGLAFLRRKVC